MALTNVPPYRLMNDPLRIFTALLNDIDQAKDEILIEVYKFNNDIIGIKIRDALIKKAKEGVKVKLLMDSWGSTSNPAFFSSLIFHGGQVRFFKKIKLFVDFFTKNHRRNHRKLIIIDGNISYIGSNNITGYCLNWRELSLRIEGDISKKFAHIFYTDFEAYNKYVYKKGGFLKTIHHNGFKIVRDKPSITQQKIMNQYAELIRSAKEQIIIETPYFLPGSRLRKAIIDATTRGVKIRIIMPKHSDVAIVDILRSRYLGQLHRHHVEILLYRGYNLHSKALLFDNKTFSIGSPNFDYRSFIYQHEITLIGEEKLISDQLKKHMDETAMDCDFFNYENWMNRSPMQKLFEYILMPLRYYL
ncbi:MAG: phosphatidylserine/phosphatidylglycerophosphate/cardiolipin synthase family protein [Bacteroidales bacterium]|nr:phosphatidylserine/phosphatidylglycerophosphate/cardiolipin synthase family protein [Bacteroidales bacterium]